MGSTILVPNWVLSFLIIIIFANSIVPHTAANNNNNNNNNKPKPIFIFGDSTVDVGTNNHLLLSQVKVNFPYNGIDFPKSKPTGRYSNGFNTADALAKLFGYKRSPPPFLYLLTLTSHFQRHLYRGANFASGGGGILDVTDKNLTVVSLSEQIRQFSSVRDNFTSMIGPSAANKLLHESLFFINIGNNDILSYFLKQITTPPDVYMSILISTYAKNIRTLYNLGARRFGIISVPPLGCCPVMRVVQKRIFGIDGCFDPINDFALTFYSSLDTILHDISSHLPGMKYSLGNAYRMTLDVIHNPRLSGFENVDTACCGIGYLNAEGGLCNATSSLCEDRRKYLFWDMFHASQKATKMAAQSLYDGPSYYVSPINFSQLTKDN